MIASRGLVGTEVAPSMCWGFPYHRCRLRRARLKEQERVVTLRTYSQPRFCLQSVTLVPQPPETPQDMSPLEQRNCLDGLPERATDGQRAEKPTGSVSCTFVLPKEMC